MPVFLTTIFHTNCFITRLNLENSSESVQFMQFDAEGNLYVYEPGAGCSGVPCKIPQGFSQEDLKSPGEVTSVTKIEDSSTFGNVISNDVHCLVPKVGVSSLRLKSRCVLLTLLLMFL